MSNNKKKSIIVVWVLIFLDVLIKVIIAHFFMEKEFLINNRLGFLPYLNQEQLSILNNELGLNVDIFLLNIINIIGIVSIVIIWNKLSKEKYWTKKLDYALAFVCAGVICSLIDKMFWGGSLDYMLVDSKIMDLKDLYLFVGGIVYFVEMFKQKRKLAEM